MKGITGAPVNLQASKAVRPSDAACAIPSGIPKGGNSGPRSSEFQPQTQLPGAIAAVFRSLHVLDLAK
jgi:hypothetical protein